MVLSTQHRERPSPALPFQKKKKGEGGGGAVFSSHLSCESFSIGRCLYPCWSGVQWEGPEWKASVGCLCQHEGLAVWDNTFVHRDHCLFQHQHQRLGGSVSRTKFPFYNVSVTCVNRTKTLGWQGASEEESASFPFLLSFFHILPLYYLKQVTGLGRSFHSI